MTAKRYEKRCARLVQEAIGVTYTTALGWVRAHQAAHPAPVPEETRALAIVDAKDAERARGARGETESP